MNEKIQFIEYHGFKNIFIGLYQGKKGYYIMYGKTDNPTVESEDCENTVMYRQIEIDKYTYSRDYYVKIPFFVTNDNFCRVISIDNREIYDHIVQILETIL